MSGVRRGSIAASRVLVTGGLGGAISRTFLETGNTSDDRSTFAPTHDTDPTANSLILVFILNTKATTPETPTISGFGVGSWTQRATGLIGTTHRLTMFSGLSGSSPVVPTEKLTANQSSVETSIADWSPITNCTLASSTVWASNGTKSIEMTAVAAGPMSAGTASGTSGFAVTPGKAYSVKARVRAVTQGRTAYVGISWYTSAGTLVLSQSGDGSGTSTVSTTTLDFGFVAPATAAYAQLRIGISSAGVIAGEKYMWDNMSVLEGGIAIDCGGVNQTGYSVVVVEYTATSTPTFVQTKTASGSAATEAIITLDAVPGSSNAYAIPFAVIKDTTGGWTAGTEVIEHYDNGFTSPNARLGVFDDLAPSDAAVRVTWSTVGNWYGIAAELTTV